MNVMDDQSIKDFFRDKALKESTVQSYKRHLGLYCELINKLPSELLDEAENEEDKNIRPRRRKIKKYLDQYQDWMIDQGFSPLRIRQAMTIVKSFYKHYDITTPRNNRYTPPERANHDIDLIPNLEDIKYALTFVPDRRFRAIILLMMSSGMGRSEVLSLKVSDFVNAVSDYYDEAPINTQADIGEMCQKLLKMRDVVPQWKIVRVKINTPYITFSSPESTHAICDMLLNYPSNSLDDFLFRGPQGGRIYDDVLTKYFIKINKKAKFEKRDRFNFFRPHNLRKFFATTLIRHRMSKFDIDRLMGHVVKDQDNAYFKLDPWPLKQEYLKCINYLSITPTKYHHLGDEGYKEMMDLKKTVDEQLALIKEQQEELKKQQEEMAMYKYYTELKDDPEFQQILDVLKEKKKEKN